MHDAILVTEGDAVEQHFHVAFDVRGGQRLADVANDLGEVAEHVFDDEYVAHAMRENIEQFDNLDQSNMQTSASSYIHARSRDLQSLAML